ncbi:MAG: amino acid adenylation domain-containing protein, partial [Sterolibacterium sp.]|nr:amino acid adenylation domain-containing protein [Sterolibacterium sp.]
MSSTRSTKNLDAFKRDLLLRRLRKAAASPGATGLPPASGSNPVPLPSSPAALPWSPPDAALLERIASAVPGGAANLQDIYPLTPLQEGLLFHHLLSEQGDAYILPVLLQIEGEALYTAFLNTLRAVLQRHDALRTALYWQDDQPLQIVLRQVKLDVERLALDPQRDPLAQLRTRMATPALHMNLQHAPLLRVQVAQAIPEVRIGTSTPQRPRYYVLLQFHHIVTDHISLDIVLGEAMTLLRDKNAPLPPPLPYRDFVARTLTQERSAAAVQHFRQRLADIDEPTAPFDLLDVHGDGSQISEAHLSVDAYLAERLRRCALQRRLNVASLFHAAMALLLAHTTGRDEVVFGSVLSGRSQEQAAGGPVVGLFINTLPLRLTLRQHSVRQFVQQVQAELIELLHHEQASLALAQQVSGVAAGTPLFTAVLNFRHSSTAQQRSHPGIEVLASQERTNYPFTIAVDDLGEGYTLVSQTDPRVAPGRINAYLHVALQELVRALEITPDKPVLSLSLLPPRERRRLQEFNATSLAVAPDLLIHTLFEAQVARAASRTALVCESNGSGSDPNSDCRLDYGTLNARANRLARHLRSHGVGPDQRVALCLERGPDMVIALLAILKAGGAYVPIDPAYPAARIQQMLEDARPVLLLSQSALTALLDEITNEAPKDATTAVRTLPTCPILLLDQIVPDLETQASDNLIAAETGLTPDNLAYVIYTSGSTGRPKGVMLEHRGVVSFLHSMQRQPGMRETDRILGITTLSFDIAALEIFLPLMCGAQLVLASRNTASDGRLLAAALQEHDITQLQATPATWRMLLASGWRGHPGLKALCGGEALSRELVGQLHGKIDTLWNLYGPTETTIWSTCRAIPLDAPSAETPNTPNTPDAPSVPIGRPIANTRIRILDGHGQLVPLGVAGEIHIGGIGVARGYLD